MMAAAALLRVDSLYKNFGGVQAIMDLSFELAKGELLGLIGPNGSGKTTAVNLITGFVKPSGGSVIYRGRNITGLAAHAVVRLGISRTFQMVKPFYQLPAYKNMIIPSYCRRQTSCRRPPEATGMRWLSTCWRKSASNATPGGI
jgi:branched-chain amino acid transport system ATP-binding protein